MPCMFVAFIYLIQEIEGGRKFDFTLDFRNQGGRLHTPISKARCLTVNNAAKSPTMPGFYEGFRHTRAYRPVIVVILNAL